MHWCISLVLYMVRILAYVSILVCLVAEFVSVLCSFFSLCYVLFVDAFNLRKRGLARFARCGRFAAAAAASRPLRALRARK